MSKIEKVVHKNIKKLSESDKTKNIRNEMRLKEDLGLGSMTLVALFTNLTDAFKMDLLQFDDEDLVGIHSVQDIINLFEKKTMKMH